MKKSEMKGIMILAIVAIAVIGIIIGVRVGKEKDDKVDKIQGGSNAGIQQGEEYTQVNSEGEKINTSKKVNENKDTGEFTLSNVSLKETNGETAISARITNKSGKKQASFLGNIVLLDKSNNEIGRIPVRISELEEGQTMEIEATITENYVNAYDYKLEK